MLLITNGAVPVLLTVVSAFFTVRFAVPVVSTVTPLNATTAWTPVPVNATVCVPAPSLTFMVTVRAVVLFGVNVTLIVQFPPTGTLAAQLFVCVKLALPVPVNVTPVNDSGPTPVLVNCTG
jgi:hypothetical protein